ncbi:hypothetical protein Caci_6552 [Catenulispora acidiphila DSM 44928]|uniref:Uncharacterized protein n=1 Tax=Catenulispora acidiphila (strain DSM 44928 / JCM 14897 / NBRC 102108 / NRRL B-24433 / ID139908) TaxID=479433 RepID=C7PYA9_CATAD|nr:hypothetical protein [Catenulispora acidiphila]ACU75399.1 hypothetical protein Caci_6552 [Catenulispora acidiphila DSM 44928]
MHRKAFTVVWALAFALLGQATLAPAQAAPARHRAEAPGSAADQDIAEWIAQVKKDPGKFDQYLEAGCIESGSSACTLTATQVAAMPSEIKRLTKELNQEVIDDPSLADGAEASAGGIQPRAGISGLSQALSKIGARSGNSFVRKLTSNSATAQQIADVAGNASVANNVAGGLTTATLPAVSKAVIGSVPVFGDVFTIADSIFGKDAAENGPNVEGIVVASVSLIATGVGLAFPPVGAVIAGALAIYSVGKTVLGWFESLLGFLWPQIPPPTPQELFDQGLDVKTTTTPIDGHEYDVVVSKSMKTVTQTILLDSKWTEYNKDSEPLTYIIRPPADGEFPSALNVGSSIYANGHFHTSLQIWQGGKSIPATCTQSISPSCGPDSDMTIGLDRPAVFTITYTVREFLLNSCDRPVCGTENPKLSLRVYDPRTKHDVAIPLSRKVVIVPAAG